MFLYVYYSHPSFEIFNKDNKKKYFMPNKIKKYALSIKAIESLN